MMQLTPEEEAIILKLREDEEDRRRRKERVVHTLKVAYEFAAWMKREGRGPSFSAFVNEFGYQPQEGEHLSGFYETVTAIIDAAKMW